MTTLSIGQRVNVTTIIKQDWQSQHSLFNGVVTEIEGEGNLCRVKVIADINSSYSGKGTYNPIAGGGIFYLSAYKIEPVIN